MLFHAPLRSKQSSCSVRVITLTSRRSPDCASSSHTPVMPLQHLSQLPSKPARHSARSAAVANLGHTHALSLAYLGAAHVAAAPSHVWPGGQSVHTLLRTYLIESHTVAAAPSQVEPLGQAVHSLLRT